MEVKFLDLQTQYSLLKNEIDEAVQAVFKEACFIKGEEVNRFEEEFSNYCDSEYCISCGNGTDALFYLLRAMNFEKGSNVIVPANTFIATAEAAVSNGLEVRFADIDEDYTISTESVESLIDERTCAVIAVHLYGLPAKINELRKITEKKGIKLIEDAAQAHGAEVDGKRVGSLADGAVFSFYPGKVLGAAGDAGAVTLNDKDLARKVRMYCDHGRSEKYLHEFPGGNSRMDTIQAAILNVKMKYLDEWVEKRNRVASIYLELLKNIKGIGLPEVRTGVRHAWHLFVIRIKNRDSVMEYLREKGVQCGVHYPYSLPEQPAFKKHLEYCGDFRALDWSNQYLSIPIGEHISDEMAQYVVSQLKKVI